MRRLRYSVPYIAGKKLPKDSDPAPRGAGPRAVRTHVLRQSISIHRPLRGGTALRRVVAPAAGISIHPPLAGRDHRPGQRRAQPEISIHPPLAGRDQRAAITARSSRHFNPPAPCGAGQTLQAAPGKRWEFQSTRPLRGGTAAQRGRSRADGISIHPPLAGRDVLVTLHVTSASPFQSTRPLRGGTQDRILTKLQWRNFNPPAPCGAGPPYQ